MLTVKVTGEEKLGQLLAQLGKALTQQQAEADLMAAAQPMVAAARDRVELGPESIHLKDNVTAAPDREHAKEKGWLAAVAIGARGVPKMGEIFYGRFLEVGTVKQSARPWLRPAADSTQDAVLGILISRIRDRIVAAVK